VALGAHTSFGSQVPGRLNGMREVKWRLCWFTPMVAHDVLNRSVLKISCPLNTSSSVSALSTAKGPGSLDLRLALTRV